MIEILNYLEDSCFFAPHDCTFFKSLCNKIKKFLYSPLVIEQVTHVIMEEMKMAINDYSKECCVL